MNYTIYFELFGRKMKYDVEAYSHADAKELLYNKIIFHKITPEEDIPAHNQRQGDKVDFDNLFGTLFRQN